MIFASVGPDATFYRALTPRWAYQPESGAGAAVKGGRFNRPGVEARYLAESAALALIEYQAESALLPPATVASYAVTVPQVIDFTGGYTAEQWPDIWNEAYCNWKELAFFDRVEPPSWVIGDLVRESGAAGLLYRSARARGNGGICLVLYVEFASSYSAQVHDPQGLLPRNGDSWPDR